MNQWMFRLSLLSTLVGTAQAATMRVDTAVAVPERGGYRMKTLASAPQRRDWVALSRQATASCRQLPVLPKPQAGRLTVLPLVKDRYFNKFFQDGGRLERLIVQQKGVPHAIVLETGIWRLEDLEKGLAGHVGAMRREGDGFLLRLPLLIRDGAGLLVKDSQTLRLSRDRGAFIINLGALQVRQARIEAWDEQAGKASLPSVEDSGFQPFMLGWSGSTTVIDASQVSGLGFPENLSHGLEFSEGPIGLEGVEPGLPPRVFLQESELVSLYSGIRATSVPEVRVCGNHILNSRQNALHLEEGSGGVLADNLISGNQGAYAISLSKGARKTLVIRNDISENKRSGIAISSSSEITLAGNTIRQNFDAVYLQASDHVLIADNEVFDNQRHGISMRDMGSVRLQGGRIGPNRGVGVMALAASAPVGGAGGAMPEAARRVPASSRRVELLGVRLEGNHSSTLVIEAPYHVLLNDTDILYPDVRRRPVFRGVLNAFETDILYRLPRQETLQLEPVSTSARR